MAKKKQAKKKSAAAGRKTAKKTAKKKASPAKATKKAKGAKGTKRTKATANKGSSPKKKSKSPARKSTGRKTVSPKSAPSRQATSSVGRPNAPQSAAGESKSTRDHDVIRHWVEQRGGRPAAVRDTGGSNDAGVLRIDFPGYSGEQTLETITWDEFFAKFEEKDLQFVYQDTTSSGDPSRFCKLMDADGTGG
jgi:hypothetical protein